MNPFSPEDLDTFVESGFLPLREAFPRELAERGRDRLWRDLGCDPGDRRTWTRPIVRLGGYADEPFVQAANTARLHAAYDQLAGRGRWQAPRGLGTFPVRFPSLDDPGDAGWHADASFYGADGSMRINLRSRGRSLLMLFLFSDVGPDDAPTRIWAGSHLRVPAALQEAGEHGLDFIELAGRVFPGADAEIQLATGAAGDVFLCHPFLIHAAQPHHGSQPRFMAQPPLEPAEPLQLQRADGDYSPVERAIRRALVVEG